MRLTTNHINKLISLGLYFGYPECCIKEFIFDWNTNREKRKLHGTGYVPCKDCNKKSEVELLTIISINRQCSTTFPREA